MLPAPFRAPDGVCGVPDPAKLLAKTSKVIEPASAEVAELSFRLGTLPPVTESWDDQLPSYEEIAAYWHCREIPGTDQVPLIDLGEPECFACGWCRSEHVHSKKALAKRWKGLERAHVIPRSLGGPDTPDNIVLLCSQCHIEAPDTADPVRFWKWIGSHPRNGSMSYALQLSGPEDPRVHQYRGPQAKVLRAMASLTPNEQAILTDLQDRSSFDEMKRMMSEAKTRIGGVSTHWGVGFSSGTIAEVLREIVDHERQRRGEGG